MPKKSTAEDVIYKFVCKNPGNCTYYISKKLGMSGGKVRYFLSKLHQKGLIKFKFDRNNPRIRKLTYPVSSWGLLPKDIKRRLKNIIKK